MSMMLEEFAERLYGQTDVFLPAREIVVEALDKAKTVHPSKEIVVIHQDCPFMDHLMELEKERRIEGRTKFVLVHNKDDLESARHQSEAGILRPSSEAASTLLWVEGRRTEQGLRNCKLRFRPQQRIHGHQ